VYSSYRMSGIGVDPGKPSDARFPAKVQPVVTGTLGA
jgi:hypothetical protein